MCRIGAWRLFPILLAAGCAKAPVVKEIDVKAECPCPPRSQVRLSIHVDSKETVAYQWHSGEGGEFDYPDSPDPVFTLPESQFAHVRCAIRIGGETTLRSVTIPILGHGSAATPQ